MSSASIGSLLCVRTTESRKLHTKVTAAGNIPTMTPSRSKRSAWSSHVKKDKRMTDVNEIMTASMF